MKKKMLAGMSGALSRSQMGSVMAGLTPEQNACRQCKCCGGAFPRATEDPDSGAICYCPDGSRIICPDTPGTCDTPVYS